MKRILIGQRGVGKTSFLNRHQIYFPDIIHYDLDAEIEKETQKKISEIFNEAGEIVFREYELNIFKRLIQQDSFVISVGGGFNPKDIPEFIEVIYISRRTDSDGRIFLNRPKINKDLTDLEDSLKLYNSRHVKFLDRADFVYHMPEGLKSPDNIEKQIFEFNLNISSYLTVQKNNNLEMKHNFLELRDDIFNHNQITNIIKENFSKNFIISCRKNNSEILADYKLKNIKYDWALELGPPPLDLIDLNNIVSAHEGDILSCINRLAQFENFHLKLCPVIKNWSELELGYEWQRKNPDSRSFLPRTLTGKSDYRWYRILATRFQKINFVQGLQDFDDQPSFYELKKFNDINMTKEFGAVVGYPIHQSRSFIEQNILLVPILEKDFYQGIAFLVSLGLNRLAVTSPLKKVAAEFCNLKLEINSLVLKKDKWIGISTDHYGFNKLVELIPDQLKKNIVVWGSGAVTSALLKEMPDLKIYSARTGIAKNTEAKDNPQILIWASSRSQAVQWPHLVYPNWKIEIILDLNYAENSMGIECAKYFNAKYISGLEMFYEQAKYQRQFWKDNL